MAKKIVKSRVPKTRNAGTLSEAGFWSFIRSTLRQKSRWWKPVALCKAKARRAYHGTNKRQKYEYQCAKCKNWYAEKYINVDHTIPVGALNCSEDLPGFVERLFCEEDNLQVLCEKCHNIKTQNEKKS